MERKITIIDEGKVYKLERENATFQTNWASSFPANGLIVWIKGAGSVDVYIDVVDTPTTYTTMILSETDKTANAYPMGVMPKYIYFKEKTAGSRTIIIEGVKATALS